MIDTEGDPLAYDFHPQNTHLPTFASTSPRSGETQTHKLLVHGQKLHGHRGHLCGRPIVTHPGVILNAGEGHTVGERKNLYLTGSREGGILDVELCVVGHKVEVARDPMKRTRMYIYVCTWICHHYNCALYHIPSATLLQIK